MSQLQQLLQVYADRLVDLSSKNKLIYQYQIAGNQQIDLHGMDFLNGLPSFSIIEQLFVRKKTIALIEVLDARNAAVTGLSQQFNRLKHLVDFTEKETGEKSLFLGWPYVEGKLINGQLLRAPLLLFPVELLTANEKWIFRRSEQEHFFFNPSFLLAYQRSLGKDFFYHTQQVPSLPDTFQDVTDFINQLYQLLKNYFAIDFSSAMYEKRLQSFPLSARSIDQVAHKEGKLKLQPYAVLGQYQTKTGAIIADYFDLKQSADEPTLEDFLSNRFPVPSSSTPLREESVYTVFPIDGYQEGILKAIRSGRSCVVEGPPGSGKSQLISNIALDYMARGKRVLIVSQKRTALKVVFERLENKGFGDFVAVVHDFKNDRPKIFKQLAKQIDALANFKKENSGLDAIQLEREFSQVSRRIDVLQDFFQEFTEALFSMQACGCSIKELYLNSSLTAPYLDVSLYYKKIQASRLAGFVGDFKVFTYYFSKYSQGNYFWSQRIDFAGFSPLIQQRFMELLEDIIEWKAYFRTSHSNLVTVDNSHGQFFIASREILELLNSYLTPAEIGSFLEPMLSLEASELDMEWLEREMEGVRSSFDGHGIEWSATDDELPNLLQEASEFLENVQVWWKSHRFPWGKKRFQKLLKTLQINGLPVNEQGVNVLSEKLRNRQNLMHHYSLLAQKSWLQLPDMPFDLEKFHHFATHTLTASRTVKLLNDLGVLGYTIQALMKSGQSLAGVVGELLEVTRNLEQKIEEWSVYLTDFQISQLLDANSGIRATQDMQELPAIFDELVNFDQLQQRLDQDEVALMKYMLTSYPNGLEDTIIQAFLNGWRISWIAHLEQKNPILRKVSTPEFLQNQAELVELVERKYQLSHAITRVRVKERTYASLEINRLGNLITYRELRHQVTKQKRIWPVKQVMESFEHEVFQLIPCWMASPETVSAIFPMVGLVDLVIFDEASQCFAEKGLPAMLRGKQVLVAGDSHQLQPYDIYQSRLDIEEETLDLDKDSLLDVVGIYFQKYWLQGHYRSEHFGLIHFSNQHFYENKLEMLPTLASYNRGNSPFSYHRVYGTWDNQTNLQEADKVVDLIPEIYEEFGKSVSIGIITFNFYQMELISALVNKHSTINREHLEIKTIEHVQGDEYDVVIFCLGYARNVKGRLIANFGLLSKAGGVYRLNVAISRARKKMHVVTSITSSDFTAKQLDNPGIALLKAYLQFVENFREEGGSISREKSTANVLTPSSRLHNTLTHSQKEWQSFEHAAWLDLVKIENDRVVEALLTDDERLFVAGSAKEAFVYHPQILKSKGWPFSFYFSRNYWLGKKIGE
jgi:hypothetical protein